MMSDQGIDILPHSFEVILNLPLREILLYFGQITLIFSTFDFQF